VAAVPQGPEGEDDVHQRIFAGTGWPSAAKGGHGGAISWSGSHAFDTHMGVRLIKAVNGNLYIVLG
jgi:hypothetical protein